MLQQLSHLHPKLVTKARYQQLYDHQCVDPQSNKQAGCSDSVNVLMQCLLKVSAYRQFATGEHAAVFDTADAFGVQNACRHSNSVQSMILVRVMPDPCLLCSNIRVQRLPSIAIHQPLFSMSGCSGNGV